MQTQQNEIDKLTLAVADQKLDGAAFVIPLDAPLPNELSASNVPTGTLMSRLRYLSAVEPETGFPFIPLSGPELMALERPWRSLQERKVIYVLTELPGAKYDVLFDTAKRAIGLRSVEWPAVQEALTTRAIEQQRLKDTKPWVLDEAHGSRLASSPSRRKPRDFHRDPAPAPVPEDNDRPVDEDR